MSVTFPNFQLDPNLQKNTAVNGALNTLQSLNQARAQYLKNQALQQTVPLAGQQAQANLAQTQAQTGLIGQQAQYFPYTATASLLGGVGKAIPALSPFAYLRNAPEQVKDVASANQIQGVNNLGQVPIPNYNGLRSGIMGIVGNLLGSNQPQQNPTAGLNGPGTQVIPQPSAVNGLMGNSYPQLPLSQAQHSRLQSYVGTPVLNGLKSLTVGMGSQDQANQVASNLAQAAQNKVAAPSLQQKYNYAQNLAKTLQTNEQNFGNPAIAFAPYMGAAGALRLAGDKAAASTGKVSPQYENYRAFEDSVPVLSEQLTQFFGGSVQPQVQRQLEDLQNPTTWDKTPGVAMRIYNNLKDIIHTEGMTAAQTVGKADEYDANFPQFDPASTYQQLAAQPKYAKDVIAALPANQRQALMMYHNSLKGAK